MVAIVTRDMHNAHAAVSQAIKKGIILPASERLCDRCGRVADVYHHHLGYEEPNQLDVTAMCNGCHRTTHSKSPGDTCDYCMSTNVYTRLTGAIVCRRCGRVTEPIVITGDMK